MERTDILYVDAGGSQITNFAHCCNRCTTYFQMLRAYTFKQAVSMDVKNNNYGLAN